MYEDSNSEDDIVFDCESDSSVDISTHSDSSSSNSEFIGYKRTKLRILDTSSSSSLSEIDTQEDVPDEDVQDEDWVDMAEEDVLLDAINFDIGTLNTGPQIPAPITEPVQFF